MSKYTEVIGCIYREKLESAAEQLECITHMGLPSCTKVVRQFHRAAHGIPPHQVMGNLTETEYRLYVEMWG